MTTTRKQLQEALLSARRSTIGDGYLRADAWFFGQQHAVNCLASVASSYNSLGSAIELGRRDFLDVPILATRAAQSP